MDIFSVSGAWREASEQAVAVRWAALAAGSSQKAKKVWEAGLSLWARPFMLFFLSFLRIFIPQDEPMDQ